MVDLSLWLGGPHIGSTCSIENCSYFRKFNNIYEDFIDIIGVDVLVPALI